MYALPFLVVWQEGILEVLSHKDAAAWVQGIGTVTGVAGAAGVAVWQQQRRERIHTADRFTEGLDLVLVLKPGLLEFMSDCFDALRHCKETKDAGVKFYALRAVALPETLTHRLDRLWIMGREGAELLEVVAMFEGFRQRMDEGDRHRLLHRLKELEVSVSDAINRLEIARMMTELIYRRLERRFANY